MASLLSSFELILIWSRVVWDVVAIVLQSLSIFYYTPKDNNNDNVFLPYNILILLSPTLLTVVTSGSYTNRWTLTFSFTVLMVLQICKQTSTRTTWLEITCHYGSILCLISSVVLSVLFPPVQLPNVVGDGKYNVGVMDVHLPIDDNDDNNDSDNNETKKKKKNHYVIARILYPTLDDTAGCSIPYLNPNTALDFCKETMKMGAPPPLKQFGWMMHNYLLIQLKLKRNATPLDTNQKLPVVIYSHGLGGSLQIYMYQVLNLAASGYVVLTLDHTDGSAPVVELHDGSVQFRDTCTQHLTGVDYVKKRRDHVNWRTKEFLGAAQTLCRCNSTTSDNTSSILPVSFQNKLDLHNVTFMGHSFGGATAITAAHRAPHLCKYMVAHEPAVDWVPDDARNDLFHPSKFEDSEHDYDGGTGGLPPQEVSNTNGESSLQQTTTLPNTTKTMFLYSHEWASKQWGSSHLVEDLFQRGLVSEFGIIAESCHSEFSDICMLTPLWLARGSGLTGQRNPVDTAQEIAVRTREFLKD